jgi:two-component system, NarL family, invasion response regulator UvrY
MNVIVCDDHPVVRHGLTQIMLTKLDVGTVREADNAQSLLDLLRESPCDIILLDVGLPGRSGLDVLRQLKQERPRMPVLVLSVHPADQYAVRALRAGASGYLTKNLATEELVKAVRTVVGGHRYVTPDVAEQLAEDLDRTDDRLPHETLSDREFEVLMLLAEGKRAKEVADALCLSYNTISTYRSRILAKLGLRSDAEIVRYALRHRLSD